MTNAPSSGWKRGRFGENLSVIALQCHCPGCGTQRLLRCRLHPAGRCPNSSSLFPPLAAVVAVAPKGRGTGVPVRPTRDEQSLILSETVVPCYRGQQLRDNIPCQAAVNLCSRALYFMPYWAFSGQRKVARHASGSPFGGAGAKRLRGQGRYRKTKTQR